MDQPTMMLAPLILFAALGLVAGTVHFMLLGRDADLLVHRGSPLSACGWRLGRIVITIAVLVWAARNGAAPLLAATSGFFLARHLVVRRLGPQS
jgi:F1F0 ATPase subunit 2